MYSSYLSFCAVPCYNCLQSEGDDEDDEFGDFSPKPGNDGIWCQHGKLFIDGSSSGDVVQVRVCFSF